MHWPYLRYCTCCEQHLVSPHQAFGNLINFCVLPCHQCYINVDLSSDEAWLQATLPVSHGGIGVHSTTMLATSAYLATAASCRALVLRLVPSFDTPPSIHQASQRWTNSYEELEFPKEGERSKQKALDRPTIEGCFRSLLSSAQDDRSRARLLAATCKESGLWLQAPPISSLGLRMDDDVIRTWGTTLYPSSLPALWKSG